MTNRQERKMIIARSEALLNGETVDGLRLNDPGLKYDYIMMVLSTLRQEERAEQEARRSKRRTRAQRSYVVYFTPPDSELQHCTDPKTESEAAECASLLEAEGYKNVESVKIDVLSASVTHIAAEY